MGNSGSAHEVGTFSSSADDFHTGGILPVVYPRDCPATWSASVHSVGEGSYIYDSLLEELPKGYGVAIDDEHRLSPIDRWSVKKDHTGFRRHAASMCPRS